MKKHTISLTVWIRNALFLGVATTLLSAAPVFAAELQPQMPEHLQVGSTIVVPIILDAKEETINALEGFMHFSPSLSPVEIRDGNSVVPFWVERPFLEQGLTENRFVRFSGIMPGGFAGSGEIFSLVFKVVSEEKPTFELKAARALLNDGQGSETTLTIGDTLPGEERLADTVRTDDMPPDTFVPLVSSDPNLYDGKAVVVFLAQDKGSGIDHYEVAEREGFKTLFVGTLTYTHARSPHVLTDQRLRSYIYVKAIDTAGNERIAVVSPVHLPLYYNVNIIALILAGILLAVFFGWHYAKRTKLQ